MKTKITPEDVADLVEFSINSQKPDVKTKRGAGNEIEVKIGRRRFVVKVTKPACAKRQKQA